MKRIIPIILTLLSFSLMLDAQVARNVVVEHTTNTVCSICANRNPGFYQNLANHPQVLHIAYHPSSPYSSCVLNQHNVSENDGRTQFYGIYGSTPRLVIQGDVIPNSTNYSNASIFSSYTGQMTFYSLDISETRTNDSILITIRISTENGGSSQMADLYLAYVEDTVFYQGPNGEAEHHDVFRKAFTSDDGASVLIPVAGNYSEYSFSIARNQTWDSDRMYVMAILQDQTTKEVYQAETNKGQVTTSLGQAVDIVEFSVYPNPVNENLNIRLQSAAEATIKVFDLTGSLRSRTQAIGSKASIDFSKLPAGMYLVEVAAQGGVSTQTVVKY